MQSSTSTQLLIRHSTTTTKVHRALAVVQAAAARWYCGANRAARIHKGVWGVDRAFNGAANAYAGGGGQGRKELQRRGRRPDGGGGDGRWKVGRRFVRHRGGEGEGRRGGGVCQGRCQLYRLRGPPCKEKISFIFFLLLFSAVDLDLEPSE